MGTNKIRLTQRRLLFKGGCDIIDVTLGGTYVQGHCLRGGYGEAKIGSIIFCSLHLFKMYSNEVLRQIKHAEGDKNLVKHNR